MDRKMKIDIRTNEIRQGELKHENSFANLETIKVSCLKDFNHENRFGCY